MSAITLRPCTANDVDIAVPLIHDSGPIAFRYVFSQDHEAQSLEFLRSAFVKGSGQFGCANHLAVERDGAMVAVAASWDARANLRHTLIAARQILGFYGLAGVGVIGRGIRMERVVKPAVAGVAYLGHLTVAPECRGQGIGREMLGEIAAARARCRSCARGTRCGGEQSARPRSLPGARVSGARHTPVPPGRALGQRGGSRVHGMRSRAVQPGCAWSVAVIEPEPLPLLAAAAGSLTTTMYLRKRRTLRGRF